ncbi:MAG: helix-turn-helix transcriptional regulator [Gaiellaceae bacterium]|jgi:transcriptional regulator with XRE-family HTH domain
MAQRKESAKKVREVFGSRLAEARADRRWTQEELAAEMDRIGHPIHRATIAKIETGKRPTSLAETIMLAAALDVAPLHLIFPIDGGEVELAPHLTVDADKALTWASGFQPLREENTRSYLRESPSGSESPVAVFRRTTKTLMESVTELSSVIEGLLDEEGEKQ